MVHKKIALPDAGLPGFSTATFSGPLEPLYEGDTPLTTDHVEVTNAGGTALTLEPYSVVSYDPATKEMAMAVQGTPAYSVLPTRVVIPAGQTTTVPIYREGYFEMRALVWDASFTTDDEKKFAFEGGVNKIFIGKKLPSDDNIVV